MNRIIIINGPNLNLLGTREPEIYGSTSFEDVLQKLTLKYGDTYIIEYYQSNHEGGIIDELHRVGFDDDVLGVVLNAGAYTHTSLAIADAIRAIRVPVVEVHISNVASREPIRHQSLIAPACRGTITGFGLSVYDLAIQALTLE
jgi:3-dehydroquinate dehydratase-2